VYVRDVAKVMGRKFQDSIFLLNESLSSNWYYPRVRQMPEVSKGIQQLIAVGGAVPIQEDKG